MPLAGPHSYPKGMQCDWNPCTSSLGSVEMSQAHNMPITCDKAQQQHLLTAHAGRAGSRRTKGIQALRCLTDFEGQ